MVITRLLCSEHQLRSKSCLCSIYGTNTRLCLWLLAALHACFMLWMINLLSSGGSTKIQLRSCRFIFLNRISIQVEDSSRKEGSSPFWVIINHTNLQLKRSSHCARHEQLDFGNPVWAGWRSSKCCGFFAKVYFFQHWRHFVVVVCLLMEVFRVRFQHPRF